MEIRVQNIQEITLLSVEEANRLSKSDRTIDGWWWLRSPGKPHHHAAFVNYNGEISSFGTPVTRDYGCVRPALRISCFPPNLTVGSKTELFGCCWTKISRDLLLCDTSVGTTAFHELVLDPNPNEFETSDIRVWLNKWLESQPKMKELRDLHNRVEAMWKD